MKIPSFLNSQISNLHKKAFSITGAVNNLYSLSKALLVSQKFRVSGYASWKNNYLIFRLPDNPYGFCSVPVRWNEKWSKKDTLTAIKHTKEDHFKIHVPKEIKIARIGKPMKWDNKFFTASNQCTKDKNNIIEKYNFNFIFPLY